MSFEPTASERAVRKDEHLDLAVRLHGQERPNAFDDVSFMHHALPGTATGLADTGTTVCGVRWEVPFYINAMTGGTQATAQVNAGLARAAAEAGVAIACGSQHIALREPERADGFQVIRREAPDAFVLANVGPTVTGEQALRAVEMLQADALQVHLNVAQELIMPEGDRDFRDWAGRIAAIADAGLVAFGQRADEIVAAGGAGEDGGNLRWGSERGADGFVIRRCCKRGGEDGKDEHGSFHGVSPLADTHPSVADFHLISGDFKDAFQIAFGGGLQLRIGAAVILIVFGTGNPLHISIFTIFGGDGRKRSGIFAGCHRSGRRCCCNRG